MRKFLVFVGLMALTAMPALADKSVDPDAGCKALGRFAHTVMFNRQNGVSLQDSLDAIKKGQDKSGYARAVIIAAFEQPLYYTESMKNQAVDEFANHVLLTCLSN